MKFVGWDRKPRSQIAATRRLDLILFCCLNPAIISNAMKTRAKCQAMTNRGEHCKNYAEPNEKYCKIHLEHELKKLRTRRFYKRPAFLIPVGITVVLGILGLIITINWSASKSDVRQVSSGVERRLTEHGVFLPKSFQDIERAIGKTHKDVGDDTWNEIERSFDFIESGSFDQAEESYKSLIRIHSDVVLFYVNLSFAQKQQGKMIEALKSARRAQEIDPESFFVLVRLATLYADMKELELAKAMYFKALKKDTATEHILNSLGTVYYEQDSLDPAVQYYRKALRIDSTNEYFHHNLGFAFHKLGQLDSCIHSLSKALELNAELPDTRKHLAIAYDEKGFEYLGQADTMSCIAAWRAAIKINPEAARTRFNLGYLLGRVGQVSEGMYHIQVAIQMDSSVIDHVFPSDLQSSRKQGLLQ